MGFSPTTLVCDAGCRIDPPVHEPTPASTMPAATDAHEPLEEPPEVWPSFHGLCTGPAKLLDSPPDANSAQLFLPTSTAPARFIRAMAVLS